LERFECNQRPQGQFKKMLSQVPGPDITLINDFPDEPSLPVDLEFINELKLGAGIPQWDPGLTVGCSCLESGCSDHEHGCSDLDIFEHKKFAYTKGGRTFYNRDNQLAIFECKTRCSCGPDCKKESSSTDARVLWSFSRPTGTRDGVSQL
jgi:hypothetical protein